MFYNDPLTGERKPYVDLLVLHSHHTLPTLPHIPDWLAIDLIEKDPHLVRSYLRDPANTQLRRELSADRRTNPIRTGPHPNASSQAGRGARRPHAAAVSNALGHRPDAGGPNLEAHPPRLLSGRVSPADAATRQSGSRTGIARTRLSHVGWKNRHGSLGRGTPGTAPCSTKSKPSNAWKPDCLTSRIHHDGRVASAVMEIGSAKQESFARRSPVRPRGWSRGVVRAALAACEISLGPGRRCRAGPTEERSRPPEPNDLSHVVD